MSSKNTYFPIRIAKNKIKQGAYCIRVLNAETFEVLEVYKTISEEILSNTDFDFKTYKYNGCNNIIKDDSKIIAYVDNINKLYGIVTFTSYVQLWWIPMDVVLNRELMTFEPLNMYENRVQGKLVEITEDSPLYYASDTKAVYRSLDGKVTFKSAATIEDFDNYIATIERNIGDLEELNITQPRDCENNDEVLHNEDTKSERELLNEEKERLKKFEDELKDREREIIKNKAFSNDCEYADVENTKSVFCENEETHDIGVYSYCMIFKVLKVGDSITIPFEVFKKLKIYTKGPALDRNSSYSRYTQVCLVKELASSVGSISCIVEVDEQKPVRITIIKEYGDRPITTDEIHYYEEKYRQWRRDRSYIM